MREAGATVTTTVFDPVSSCRGQQYQSEGTHTALE